LMKARISALVADGAEGAAPDRLAFDDPEPDLDQAQPWFPVG
jgi:hypothetical protein